MLHSFSEKPTMSIPGACNGWAETQAAYRFLAHEEIEWTDILAPHQQQTHARIREQPVVLCIEDTTELDFNGQQIDGLGRLSYDAQRGMYLHPTYAITPQRVPLGVLNLHMWAREAKSEETKKAAKNPAMPAQEKESARWIKGYEHVAALAETLEATQLVYIADREGDIMDLMATARDMGHPADWLIRSQHNRVLPTPEEKKLWESVEAQEPIAEICFALKSRRKGNKRKPGKRARYASSSS